MAGLTPVVLANWLYRRLNAMLAAFAGQEGKLAWMNLDANLTTIPGYQSATSNLAAYVLGRGIGYRGGIIDFQHTVFESPIAGSFVDENGYSVVDDHHPIFRGKRVRCEENEEYGRDWVWRFGPLETPSYRHRISTLHSLCLHQNIVMVSPEILLLNPDLNAYASTVMGLDKNESPDAWTDLRECATRKFPVVKNLERWLYQRDVPGAMTTPAQKVTRFPLWMDPPGKNFDWDARKTDRANGQSGIAFRIDQEFFSTTQAVEIKVTHANGSLARWYLEYSDGSSLVKSPEVKNTGDGKWKTVTFTIPNLAADHRLPGEMDFQIKLNGEEDLAVSFVRVIKHRFSPVQISNSGLKR